MSSISSVGGGSVVGASKFAQQSAAAQQARARVVDPDNDGDNDAGVSKAAESTEKAAASSMRTASGGIDVEG